MSSGAPPAAIAIVRVSGPGAFAAATAMAGAPLPPPRRATLRALRAANGELLDRALVLVFPAAASATGEELVEFHCHGGRAVIATVEAALVGRPGLRAAEPGEFTRRALLNGRIDLAQAQGLADLLAADSEAERRLAIAAAEGGLSRTVRDWLDRLTTMAAQLEASIDFAEEGDVVAEATSLDGVIAERDRLLAAMTVLLAEPPVERWREGWRVVVAGPPNAGKSTLVNLLARREAAIVAATAGTTRDRIEVAVRRDGVGYLLIDTAGIRDATGDPIERIGIERGRQAIATADLALWLGEEPPADPGRSLWLHPRNDEPGRTALPAGRDLGVSRSDATTIERLWRRIADHLATAHRLPFVALHRDERRAVAEAVEALAGAPRDIVLFAEAIRAARRALASILGIDATAALLDRVFSQFCIGK